MVEATPIETDANAYRYTRPGQVRIRTSRVDDIGDRHNLLAIDLGDCDITMWLDDASFRALGDIIVATLGGCAYYPAEEGRTDIRPGSEG